MQRNGLWFVTAAIWAICSGGSAFGQGQGPAITSPEVHPDRKVTFRILAREAKAIRLVGSDIPGNGQGAQMAKSDSGVWEVTVGPVPPGAYRYHFNMDGVAVIDTRSSSISESNNNVWSLVVVPGSEMMDTRGVPHGAVAEVNYYYTALSRFRRMHVYTPPGYESGKGRYPVFYLLHGAGDNDNAWSTVGRARIILDNLIAAGKAKSMLVVMPAGHTRAFGRIGGPPPSTGGQPPVDEFVQDFVTDLKPYVEKNYRALSGRQNRAIAGLSMGGMQTLNVAIPNLDQYAYVGVFSSGIFGPPRTGDARSPWEEQNQAHLNNASAKKGLKLLWLATGKDDFLLNTTRQTVDTLKRYGFSAVYEETDGGHTWLKWRDYLIEFAPRLFK